MVSGWSSGCMKEIHPQYRRNSLAMAHLIFFHNGVGHRISKEKSIIVRQIWDSHNNLEQLDSISLQLLINHSDLSPTVFNFLPPV